MQTTAPGSATQVNGGGDADAFNVAADGLGGTSTSCLNGQDGEDVFTVTGLLGSLVTLDIDGGPDRDTLNVPAGSVIVPTGPDSGSVTDVVTSYTSIENLPRLTAISTLTWVGAVAMVIVVLALGALILLR